MTYHELEILIRDATTSMYSIAFRNAFGVELVHDGFAHFEGLREARRLFAALDLPMERRPDDLPSRIAGVGSQLYAKVFGTGVGQVLMSRTREVASGGNAMRLRLTVEPAELQRVPWECLNSPEGWLCVRDGVLLSRMAPGAQRSQGRLARGIPKGLLFAAGCSMRPEAELDAAAEALSGLIDSGGLELEVVPPGSTLAEVEGALLRERYDTAIFVGEGEPDASGVRGTGAGFDLGGAVVSARDLARLLASSRSMRLVLACAGTTADGNRREPFEHLARELMLSRVPSAALLPVVVRPEAMGRLLATLFFSLAGADPVDVAVSSARRAMQRGAPETADFATVVLYTSDPTGWTG